MRARQKKARRVILRAKIQAPSWRDLTASDLAWPQVTWLGATWPGVA